MLSYYWTWLKKYLFPLPKNPFEYASYAHSFEILKHTFNLVRYSSPTTLRQIPVFSGPASWWVIRRELLQRVSEWWVARSWIFQILPQDLEFCKSCWQDLEYSKFCRQDFQFSKSCRTRVNLLIFKIFIVMSNCVRAELGAASSSTNFVYQKTYLESKHWPFNHSK